MHDVRGKEVEGDPKLSSTWWYRQLVTKFIRLAVEVSTYEEYHKILDKCVDITCKQIMELYLQAENIDNHTNDNPTFVSDNVMQPKGFKKWPGLKRQKQLKSWVELQAKKRKRALIELSCSTPPTYEPP